MTNKVQLKDANTQENIYPITSVESVEGLDNKIGEVKTEITGGATEDYDTFGEVEEWIKNHKDYDDSELRKRIENLEKNGVGGSGSGSGDGSSCNCPSDVATQTWVSSEIEKAINGLEGLDGYATTDWVNSQISDEISKIKPYDDSELQQQISSLQTQIEDLKKIIDGYPEIKIVDSPDKVGTEPNIIYFVKEKTNN